MQKDKRSLFLKIVGFVMIGIGVASWIVWAVFKFIIFPEFSSLSAVMVLFESLIFIAGGYYVVKISSNSTTTKTDDKK